MKFSIYINQPFCIENSISLQEATLLSALCEAPTWSKDFILEGAVWYWISKSTLEQELPIIGSWSNFKRIKQSLKEKGFICYTVYGNKQLFKLTETGKCYSRGRIMTQQGQDNDPVQGQDNDPVQGQDNDPNHNTNDPITNDPITNHKDNPKDINPELTMDDKPESVDVNIWFTFLKYRKKKRATLTKIALDGIIRESAKTGMDLEETLLMIMERGWQSFKADWVSKQGYNQQSNHSQANRHTGFDKKDYTNGLIEQEDGTYAF